MHCVGTLTKPCRVSSAHLTALPHLRQLSLTGPGLRVDKNARIDTTGIVDTRPREIGSLIGAAVFLVGGVSVLAYTLWCVLALIVVLLRSIIEMLL